METIHHNWHCYILRNTNVLASSKPVLLFELTCITCANTDQNFDTNSFPIALSAESISGNLWKWNLKLNDPQWTVTFLMKKVFVGVFECMTEICYACNSHMLHDYHSINLFPQFRTIADIWEIFIVALLGKPQTKPRWTLRLPGRQEIWMDWKFNTGWPTPPPKKKKKKKKNWNGILLTICGCNNWYQCMRLELLRKIIPLSAILVQF